MTTPKLPVARSPRGVLTRRPLVTRLMPDEQAAVEARAKKQRCSLSSMARLLIIKGMAADASQPTSAATQRHTTSIAED
ncbi:hypothetical protein [Ralstonia mannitolilytica]|jgi:hypothetical protein|uniref:hypothetical protein n=1 Tax=Ralstonia mannitolilytica TaxID=105219 RepID=UPI0010FEA9D9|nr:hypothetical protein [Ralstonia mannitolilytica]